MTISRKLGWGYGAMVTACVVMVSWLAYHEFIEEPAEYAAKGLTDIHRDTKAEFATVCFLGAVPLLLGVGWWWMRRVLAPLGTLATAVQALDSTNLGRTLPRSMNGDEIDQLTAGFNAMTGRLATSIHHIHEFTLHASHELKTPLALMRMQLETVQRENAMLPQEQTKWLEEQIDEVTRLTKIVDSLTLLTNADAGLLRLNFAPVSLGELVEDAFQDLQYLAQEQGITATLSLHGDARVQGDRHRLRQLLLILIDNAVKYNRPGGRISIGLGIDDGVALLSVNNTGKVPANPEALFGRFVRGEDVQSKVEGCGLGLSIARSIAEAHAGTIRLVPVGEEEVSVQFRIPLTVEAAEPSRASEAHGRPLQAGALATG